LRKKRENHANQVDQFAQIGHSCADLEKRQSMAYEVFFRTLNNARLQRYLLAARLLQTCGTPIIRLMNLKGQTSSPVKWKQISRAQKKTVSE